MKYPRCCVCGGRDYPKVRCRGCSQLTCCLEFFGPRKLLYCKTCHRKKTEAEKVAR